MFNECVDDNECANNNLASSSLDNTSSSTQKVYDNPMLGISTTEMPMQFVAMRNVKTPLDHIHVYVLEEVSSILVIRCLILHKLIRLSHAGLNS